MFSPFALFGVTQPLGNRVCDPMNLYLPLSGASRTAAPPNDILSPESDILSFQGRLVGLGNAVPASVQVTASAWRFYGSSTGISTALPRHFPRLRHGIFPRTARPKAVSRQLAGFLVGSA